MSFLEHLILLFLLCCLSYSLQQTFYCEWRSLRCAASPDADCCGVLGTHHCSFGHQIMACSHRAVQSPAEPVIWQSAQSQKSSTAGIVQCVCCNSRPACLDKCKPGCTSRYIEILSTLHSFHSHSEWNGKHRHSIRLSQVADGWIFAF